MGTLLEGFKTGLADIFTLGGYSKEKQAEEQRRLNELQMQREDNTYQRTINDMSNAGLSPLAMSGLNSANALTNGEDGTNNAFNNAIAIAQTISQVATGLAQAKNLNAGTTGQNITNELDKMDLNYLKNNKISPLQENKNRELELAKVNKGFWGRIASDLYDNTGDKINELIKTAGETVKNGLQDLAKGKESKAYESATKAVEKIKHETADKAAEKSKIAGKVKEYEEKKKKIIESSYYTKMKYWQSEIDKYARHTDTESLKKLNEARKKKEEAIAGLEKEHGKHWTEYLK